MPKLTIQKLCNCYYSCLNKLFKFNLVNKDLDEINTYLKNYNLFAIQYRILYRICLFSYKVIKSPKSPPNLKNQLKSNSERGIGYNLRNRDNFSQPKTNNRYGDYTFNYIFSKFLNKFPLHTFENVNTLKKHILANLKNNYVNFSGLFPHFDLYCKIYT
jgi:hypothetical protein